VRATQSPAIFRLLAAVDEIPLGAQLVIKQIIFASEAIIFLVVLVGFGGVFLLRKYTKTMRDEHFIKSLSKAFDFLPDELATVAAPMLILSGIILGGYFLAVRISDWQRIHQMADGARVLEQSGDFRTAANIRKRMLALNAEDREAAFLVQRDLWLASFVGAPGDRRTAGAQFSALAALVEVFGDRAEHDMELRASWLYLAERSVRPSFAGSFISKLADADIKAILAGTPASISQPPEETRQINAAISETLSKATQDYIDASQDQKQPRSVLGKLVYMSRIRLLLDYNTVSLHNRVQESVSRASQLISAYPRYAPGYALRSQLNQFLLEELEFGPSADEGTTAKLLESIASDEGTVSLLDPGFYTLLVSTKIDFTAEDIRTIKDVVPTDTNTINAAGAVLTVAADRHVDFTKGVVGLPQAKVEAARVVPLAAHRSMQNQRLLAAAGAARQAFQKTTATAADCTNVLLAAAQAEQYLAFESWLTTACNGKVSNKAGLVDLADIPVSRGLAYLY
jgi:hypothetical protein